MRDRRLRRWTLDEGARTAQVQYRPPGSHTRVIGAFPAEDVCEDTADRSHGRRE
jgi:hypothetical protein